VEAVEQTLNVKAASAIAGIIGTLGKAGEDEFLFVRDAVAVNIFEIPNVRSGAHEQAAVVPKQGGRPRQILCKDRALIEVAVSIGIDEQANSPQPFVAPLGVVA